jgi:phosphoglycerol transferase MdoB-like AlkP superfamily enzyme
MHFLKLPFKIIAASVAILFVCRLILLASYPDYFSMLSTEEIFVAFAQGIRFDISITVLSQSIILLLLIVPSARLQKRVVLQFLSGISLIIMLVVLAVTLADISYFGEVKRHLGSEITRLQDDFGIIVDIALSSRLLETMASLFCILLVIVGWYFVIISPMKYQNRRLPQRYWSRGALAISAFFVILFLGRGLILQSKPLDIVDAFSQGNQQQANLTLNGAFVALKEGRANAHKRLSYLTATEFQQNPNYKERQAAFKLTTQPLFKQKNVVFVLLESWSYKYIDGLAGGHYQVTPFMDQLIRKSVVWDRFYAAGQRSILGIQAVLASVPVISTQPILGYGLELNALSRLAAEVDQKGFYTLMVQSSNRRSFHMDGIAKSLGFKEYSGKEDMPILRDYPQEVPRFGWDYETLMHTKSRIDAQYQKGQPFFSFTFTGTTHEPFSDPGAEFHVYPHSDANEEGFLNTLRYSDWSIEQFMTEAAKEPWYQDTVFVFSADHVLRVNSDDLHSQFHIPLIIYTPDGSLPAEHRTDIASQYDLMPSLLELMGVETDVSTFGRSLWRDDTAGSAVVYKGAVTGLITSSAEVAFTEKETLLDDRSGLNEPAQEQLASTKWRLQYADRLLKNNQWVQDSAEQ